MRELISASITRPLRSLHRRSVEAVRAALGEAAFAAASVEGRALSLDAAVALALEQIEAPASDETWRDVT